MPAASAAQGDASPSAAQPTYEVPAKAILGPVSIYVDQQLPSLPGRVIYFDQAQNLVVLTKDKYGRPLLDPLAYAMNLALPGDVLGLNGYLKGVEIGKFNPSKGNAVYRDDGSVYAGVGVQSWDASQPATIEGVAIQGNVLEPGGHGVDDLTFQNLIIKNRPFDRQPLIVFANSIQGRINLYNIAFVGKDNLPAGQNGMKWGMRAQGKARMYDLRGILCEGADEHCLYLDAPGHAGTASFDPKLSGAYISGVTQSAPSGRTAIQIVNRTNEVSPFVPGGIPDPAGSRGVLLPGGGTLVIRASNLWTYDLSGGSAVTVVGFLGNVFLEDISITTNTGGVVVWSDESNGTIQSANGFVVDYLKLKNITINAPNADRTHIAISGVEHLQIEHPMLIDGNQNGLDLHNRFGGSVHNGLVEFLSFPGLLSDYVGTKKMTLHDVPVTAAQMNSRQVD